MTAEHTDDGAAAREDTRGEVVVVEVSAADTYELRYEILRRGTPSDNVNLEADRVPGTRHLAVRDNDGRLIATSTWSERECPLHPGVPALQLRAMAVDPEHRRRRLGATLIEAGVALAVERHLDLVWANARDTALDFYVANGFVVTGDGFVTPDTQIPHHVVVRFLKNSPRRLPDL